jgi:hypothetical protein
MGFFDRDGVGIDSHYWGVLHKSPTYKRVLETEHEAADEIVWISTVWTGIDHVSRRDPRIFETMILGSALDGVAERYATTEEAKAGHARWVDAVAKVCLATEISA